METLFDIELPPYSPPSLAEIATRSNGLTAVGSFSGGGGSSTGLKAAGWDVPYVIEFIPSARETYLANYPETIVDGRDIREIAPEDILGALWLARGELDLFEGSPPCSSFSLSNSSKDARYGSGKVKNYSDGVKQATDDLFAEWVRLVEGLYPRAILAENVPAMQIGDGAEFYDEVVTALESLGYWVTAKVYNAASFGAATARRRLIITGLRRDVATERPRPLRPTVAAPYTLRDALESLPRPIPDDELAHADIRRYAIYPEWLKLAPGESSERYFNLVRPSLDAPLPTVTFTGSKQGAASVTHPTEPRQFTATEVAWISGFPADYRLEGSPAQRYERIGRAVPPPLYEAVGRSIASYLGGSVA